MNGRFLHKAAHATYQHLVVREALAHLRVGDVMRRRVDAVPPGMSVDQLVREHVMQSDQELFPVVVGTRLMGVVGIREAHKLPPDLWPTTPVSSIMVPLEQVTTVTPDGDVTAALQRLDRQSVPQLPVVEHGELRGILSGVDILKWVMLRSNEQAARG
jgi:CBS domain-containing protein